ncbi:MAG TPA: class I SAM-dependent methyltransferase [Pyrinomonadaceae bacterium]|nr:class I SAM-dependent methyltransferase [Pyrinomonadaceae bacterium]
MPLVTYNELAPNYEAISRFEQRFFPTLRAEALSLLPANAQILEVGAGTGLNFIYYPAGASGVASEPNSEMIKRACDKQKPSRVSLVQNCAEQLPFPDDSFEAAFATLVFCSVASPQAAFAELRRVVRTGGIIILLDHVRPAGLLGFVFDVLNLFTVPLFADHMNRRTSELAKSAGLEVVEVRSHAWGIINLITCKVG